MRLADPAPAVASPAKARVWSPAYVSSSTVAAQVSGYVARSPYWPKVGEKSSSSRGGW